MIGSRAWRALMRRNVVYRIRNWVGSLLELALPVAFIAILVAIKVSLEDNEDFSRTLVEPLLPNDYTSFKPLSFTDYLTAIQAERKCHRNTLGDQGPDFHITGMEYPYFKFREIEFNGYNWQVPFVKCDSRACKEDMEDAKSRYCEYQIFAIAPATADDVVGKARADAFRDYIFARYPQVLQENVTKVYRDSQFTENGQFFVVVFESDKAIEDYVRSGDYGKTGFPQIGFAVVFSEGATDNDYAYKLRLNSTNYNSPDESARPATRTTPDTNLIFNRYAKEDNTSCTLEGGTPYLGPFQDSCTAQYVYNGAITVQRLVGDFIMNATLAEGSDSVVAEHGVNFVSFPARSYYKDGFYAAISGFAPLLVMLGLLYPVSAIIRSITLEKELRQKELMKMMSVAESDIGWSWFLSYFWFHLITVIACTATTSALYTNSTASYLFFFWLFAFISTIIYGQLISSFLTKATRATLIGLLVYFLGFFLTFAVDIEDGSSSVIAVLSLHPVAAFSFGLQEIGRLEDAGIGVRSSTWNQSDNASGYTLSDSIFAMIVCSILWGIVSWYLNRVVPSDFGTPLPWYFPFTKSYWCPRSAHAPVDKEDQSEIMHDEAIPIEPVSDALRQQSNEGKSIEIHKLQKQYGEKTAVDNLTLSMYSGQVTALLGHNGAGKTTTINMLTGMVAPTNGYAVVAGKDIRTQMNQIREEIGICLQHDCLFPMLTVKEHVQFFARIKGLYSRLGGREAEAKVMESIEDVALLEKRDTLSKNLSGGMKRKLSVAIAFCGDSKTVLLDEPTSGMDPFSRRFTWNVIRQYREDRCIILTTHFMDEADILGDRIAIMSEGQLRCVGSPFFLKKSYGVGYQLTIEKKPVKRGNHQSGATYVSPKTKSANAAHSSVDESINERLKQIVMGNVPKATFLSDVGTEMSFQLPTNASSDLNPMFEALDKEVKNSRIESYGVSDDGCQLTIEKIPVSIANSVDTGVPLQDMDESLKQIVKQNVPKATVLSDVGTEMSFQLPINASSDFKPMFEALDKEVESNRIVTYGVSITTLDEVFLMVARGETGEKEALPSSVRAGGVMQTGEDKSTRSRMDLEKEGLFMRHVQALFQKRALNFKRDKKAWICSTILPSIFVLIGFIVFKFASPTRDLSYLSLTLEDYNVDVSQAPRNPIPFNNPGSFTCSPGLCMEFWNSIVNKSETGEFYSYCGGGFLDGGEGIDFLLELNQFASCTIANSNNNIAGISEAGATPVGMEASDVGEASASVLATSLDTYEATQYGALYYTSEVGSTNVGNSESYTDSLIASCKAIDRDYFDEETACEYYRGAGYVVSYNFTGRHVALLYQNLADESLIREGTGDDSFTISAGVHPMPITAKEASYGAAEDSFLAWLLIVLSFPLIAGTFATFVVSEKANKAKHLQTVAGVKPSSYWVSSYLWDIANYQIPMWITVILMFAFGVSTFTTTERGVLGGVIVLFILYGPASAGFTYCISFMFSNPSMCNLFVIIFNFIIALAGPMVIFILRIIGEDLSNPNQTLVTVADILEWVLKVFPSFCLGKGLFNAINIEAFEFLAEEPITVWDKSILLYEVVFLAIESFLYVALAIQIDIWSTNPRRVSQWNSFVRFLTCRCFCGGNDKRAQFMPTESATLDDEDVLAEQQRVQSGEANDDLIVCSELTKRYPNGKLAVNNVSFGIPPGQCFGLLGINGAGKTTTMGFLTAEFPPTSGDATLAGFSVTNEPEQTRRRIGYCPQFDAHFANMTGREHVEMYASIKGVPIEFVKEAAATKLEEVGLNEFDSDRLSAGYSGGMKRKLSVACATIGQPQIVFLDEPSTGMDPVARRDLWQVISDMVAGGNIPDEERTSVILTTHSMEECEALCPRIAIMANGKLRCLGSAQRLKTRFGQGYQVELKLKIVEQTDTDYQENLVRLQSGTSAAGGEEGGTPPEQTFLTLQQTLDALRALTGDDYLANMVRANNPTGYVVYKSASSDVGVSLDVLASFATDELRMRNLQGFVQHAYPNSTLRERQDGKARYEVPSEGVRISNIFANIEDNKEVLQLADYGVSQTSLEQVFNMHAAEAEKLKQGTLDH